MAEYGQKQLLIMQLSWFILPAILLSFLFIVVPGILWLANRLLRKPLGENILQVSWNKWGIILALCCWIADRVWVHFVTP
jgi:hypothetical protein